MSNEQARGRFTLLLISAIFFTPILLAMYLYFSDSTWRPSESTQRGELVTPPIQLPDESFAATDGDFQFRETWSLLVPAGDQCDSECATTLEHVRQIRLSLGPKMTRLQNVFVPTSTAPAGAIDRTLFPKLIISNPEAAALIHERIGDWQNGQFFLVDPLGNLMMSYAPGTEMADVRKDLGHLLKISEIG